MTDKEAVIVLCEKLGLKKIWPEQPQDVYDDEFAILPNPDGTSRISIGSGKSGYSGFYVVFQFDAGGNLVDHGVFE